MNKLYTIIDDQWIKLIDGPYAGVMYKYGKVNFIEEVDQLRLKFEYETDTGQQLDEDFAQYIGPILIELIEQGISSNSIVYTGGTDAD